MRVDSGKLGHAEICDLGSSASDHQDIVSRQVSVDETVGV